MQTEIERRFLLSRLPVFPEPIKSRSITQGYFELTQNTDSLRIRLYRDTGKAYVTGKQGTGMVRKETPEKPPFEIAPELAQVLLNAVHHSIDKVRFPCQGWEIDLFEGPLAGVIFAEKELLTPDQPLNIPEWLSPYIKKEVTNSLSNLHLARLASDLRGSDVLALPYVTMLRTVPKIVITGPPCSGKTTVMKRLKHIFPEFHFVPEVATVIMGQLNILPGETDLELNRFQRTIYRTQKIFEESSMQFAITQNKKGMILDRGTADQPAYIKGGVGRFEAVLGTTLLHEYSNYDAVLYLELPSREVYEANLGNNPNRRENYDQAVPLGEKLYEAWRRHSRFFSIEAMPSWQEKEEKIVACLSEVADLKGAH